MLPKPKTKTQSRLGIMYLSLRFFRGLFIIDDKGVLRQITMNDLPVSVLS